MYNEQDLISIIVPVYNAEKTIERCVKSIQKSTYKKIEMILINDGSTDNSLFICEKLQKYDDRIRIITKENSGAGLSRESGLQVAKGKYIGFVDADDYINEEMYFKLYEKVKNESLDVCFCGNYECFPNGEIVENNIRFPKEIYEEKEIKSKIARNAVWFAPAESDENHMFSLWRGLYSKEIIKENDLHFLNERVINSEDGFFNFQYLCNAKRLGFVHECLYYYGIYQSSLTNDKSRWEDIEDVRTNNWYRSIASYAKEKNIKKYIIPYLNAEYLGKVRKYINELIFEKPSNFKYAYKEEKKKYFYKKNIRILFTRGNGIKNKVDLVLCFYFISLYRYFFLKGKKLKLFKK